MARKSEVVRCYKAKDGQVFDTWREAQAHNKTFEREAEIALFVHGLAEGKNMAILGNFFPKDIPDTKALLSETIKAWEEYKCTGVIL